MKNKTDNIEPFKHIVEIFEKFEIDLSNYLSLVEKEDWTFIIQLHSYLEEFCRISIVNLLNKSTRIILTEEYTELDFSKFVNTLSMGDKNIGYISFLTDTNLLPSSFKRFLKELTQLRNKFVHDHNYLNFSIKDYYQELDSNQKKNFHYLIQIQKVDPKSTLLGDSKIYKDKILSTSFQLISELSHFIGYVDDSSDFINESMFKFVNTNHPDDKI
ncbi:hypothetical protein ACKGJO_10405 [Gracilimonas sp. Q87]|uniref:hypothetical protein n=1 Tax=Gracilimonas sp. Q87 TaxID=3384766 RepID=UPI003983FBB0